MKVQCQCGAKYVIDVTPEMARDPVRFVCPNCNLDLSGPINDLVRQELGIAAAPPAQVTPAAPAPKAKSTAMRVPTPARPKSSEPAVPTRLSLSTSASTSTHGTPVAATMPPEEGSADFGQPCPKHPGEVSVEHCRVCRKPICPKCMELFGFVCSPLCQAKAESHGVKVPVFAGQKSVVEARRWRKIWWLGMGVGVGLAVFAGVWIWWTLFATRPHAIFSVRFPEMSYAGNSRIVGKDQIVFLHGGLLARYKLGSKTATWTSEIITKQQIEAEVDRQMDAYQASLASAIRRGADSESRPHVPLRQDLEKEVQKEMESSLQLFVHEQNIWIERNGKLTGYDWETGKAGKEITVAAGRHEANVEGGELQFADENAFGQLLVTRISLASGEAHTETIGQPRSSAVLASTRTVKPAASVKKGAQSKTSQSTGLPTNAGVDNDKPMDPAQVAQDAQNLPYAAKIALPATLSNAKHQNDILNEIKEDEPPDRPAGADRNAQVTDPFSRGGSFVKSKYGYLEWVSKVLEARSRTRKVMKDKPGQSALESNPSITNTAAMANEILNEMQRGRGGDSVSEDISRYQVTVHRVDATDVPDWTGEIIGPPSVIEQKTVTIVSGGEMFVVLDKSNKKLWQANLAYKIKGGSGLDDNDPGQTSMGAGPVIERDDALYVFDEATLTAFDLASGNVRWRVPTIGIVGVFFDDLGSMYVNSTTADLDSIRFSRQIDINKKISAVVLRIDCKTGKVYWNVQPGGLVSHVEGKFVFCFASHQADDLDPDSLTTLPGMLDSLMDIRRLDPKTGKIMWVKSEPRCPLSVRFNGNIVELVFRKEVEVLKFLTL